MSLLKKLLKLRDVHMYDDRISETIIKFLNRYDDSYYFEQDDVIMDFIYTRGGWVGFVSCEKYIMIMENTDITIHHNDPLLTKDLIENISSGYIGDVYQSYHTVLNFYELYMSKMFKNTCIPHKVSLFDKLIGLKDLNIYDNRVIDVITKYIFVESCHGISLYKRTYYDKILNMHTCYIQRPTRTQPYVYGYMCNYEIITIFTIYKYRSGDRYGRIHNYKYNDHNAKILSKMDEKITEMGSVDHEFTEKIVCDVIIADFIPKFNKTKSARSF